ncbi:hypothetical protein E1A91_A11G189300v1 [Gossypium mustelinum]|uniref:Uncharacterized protein n=1 Tax=Gossypium mustelinum TaxID=34275 RepID=A0A5D2X8J3_GOSMU|nr:hypothetical protein E1A91_A11G189300v1 [Gossypium mustelinum]
MILSPSLDLSNLLGSRDWRLDFYSTNIHRLYSPFSIDGSRAAGVVLADCNTTSDAAENEDLFGQIFLLWPYHPHRKHTTENSEDLET